MEVFMGTIVAWPITYAPDYFALCQGQTLALNQYQALYSLIGTYFGGNGSSNFMLPNLCGRTPVGYDPNHQALPSSTFGAPFGTYSSTVTLTANNMPAHTHGALFQPVTGTQPITLPAVPAAGSLSVSVAAKVNTTTAGAAAPASGADVYLGGVAGNIAGKPVVQTGPYDTTQAAATANLQGLSGSVTPSAGYTPGSPAATVGVNVVTGGSVAIGVAGASVPFAVNALQPSLTMNFLICLQGLYPMRP